MFVCNIKLNKTGFFKILLAIMAIFCICLAVLGTKKMFSANQDKTIFNDSNCMPTNEIANLTDENYTNVLKEVHENLNTYIGQKISYTGYIYRIPELEENQFILARDMQLENSNQTVVVGFLCYSQEASMLDNYTWVKITGTIQKGNYFGDIPCIQITEFEKTDEPQNCIVPPPNDKFIPTSVIY